MQVLHIDHLKGILMGLKILFGILFLKRVLKGPEIRNFAYLENIYFYFSSNF
jgi:hypothetical protein